MMKRKQYLLAGFVFHVLANIWFIASHVSALFGGNFEAWVFAKSTNLFNYGMILAVAAISFYAIDLLVAFYKDFSFFSVIKLPLLAAMMAAVAYLYSSPAETIAKIAYHVASELLILVQFKAFKRDYR